MRASWREVFARRRGCGRTLEEWRCGDSLESFPATRARKTSAIAAAVTTKAKVARLLLTVTLSQGGPGLTLHWLVRGS